MGLARNPPPIPHDRTSRDTTKRRRTSRHTFASREQRRCRK
jgi:hypothetical protein